MIGLRSYQEEALNKLRNHIVAGGRRVVLQSPTGSGKTVLAAEIIRRAVDRGSRVMFVVPAIALIDQTVRVLVAAGVPVEQIGVIQADHPMTAISRPVQVASVQTLLRRELVLADLVLIDECHRQFDWISNDWLQRPEWRDVPVIGLSATPWTKGLGKVFNYLIVVETTASLIKQKHLTPFRVFAPTHPDLGNVKTVAGDYQRTALSGVMRHLVADVVDSWRRLGEDRPTFVFAVDRNHARDLCDQFRSCEIAAEYVDYLTPREEREDLRERFERGDIKIVVSVETMILGIDWPSVSCLVIARPTKSEALFVQAIGRGLRPAEGKTDCLIIDHTDNHLRLGFVTQIGLGGELDDGKRRRSTKSVKKEKLPSFCPQCSLVTTSRVCGNCGYEMPQPQSIAVRDGELAEAKEAGGTRGILMRMPPAQLFGLLKYEARRRKYSAKFPVAMFKKITNRWPSPETKAAPEIEIDHAALRGYITSRNIAYAKAKGKKNADTGSPAKAS